MDLDIFSIICRDCVEYKIRAKKKNDVMRELAEIASRSPKLAGISADTIAEHLLLRESKGTTGLGNGIAIPHSPIPGLDEFVIAIAVSRHGVNFEAIDKRKVHIFAVILGPEGHPREHIQLLAQLSHLFRDENFRENVRKARTSTALFENFAQACDNTSCKLTRDVRKNIVIMVIQKTNIFDDIVEYLTQIGIVGASVIESEGVRSLMTGTPLFADFIYFLGDRSDESVTMIFAIPQDRRDVIIAGIEDITGNLDTHSGVMITVIEPAIVRGSLELL